MRKTFISQTELLLIASRYDTGTEWLGHPADVFETAEDVAREHGNDEAMEFWRIDLITKTVEDVSEDVASAWLDLNPEAEEGKVPLFVEQSEAWELFLEDMSFGEPMTEHEMRRQWGTHEANGRLA